MIIAGVERGFGFWALGERRGVDVLGNDGSETGGSCEVDGNVDGISGAVSSSESCN